MEKLREHKKIVIAAVLLLVIIIAIAVVTVVTGRTGREEESVPAGGVETITEDEQESATGETTTASQGEMSTSPAMNQTGNSEETKDIEAFLSGNYYFSGAMVSGGTSTELDMAINGSDFQTTMDMDGMKISMLYLNDNVYFVDVDNKKYFEMSSILMKTLGVDMSEMQEITSAMNFSDITFTSTKRTETTLDSKPAVLYSYISDSQQIDFYLVGGELKEIDLGGTDSGTDSKIIFNTFSSEIPAGMMTVSGYEKSNMLSFFGGLEQ